MPLIELAERLALLVALALFSGLLSRKFTSAEEIYKRDEPTVPNGIRTVPMVGIAGATLYLFAPRGLGADRLGRVGVR